MKNDIQKRHFPGEGYFYKGVAKKLGLDPVNLMAIASTGIMSYIGIEDHNLSLVGHSDVGTFFVHPLHLWNSTMPPNMGYMEREGLKLTFDYLGSTYTLIENWHMDSYLHTESGQKVDWVHDKILERIKQEFAQNLLDVDPGDNYCTRWGDIPKGVILENIDKIKIVPTDGRPILLPQKKDIFTDLIQNLGSS